MNTTNTPLVQFYRLGPTWLELALGTSFGPSAETGDIEIRVYGKAPRPLAGALLEAVRAFLDGSLEFPVSANGVLDLWTGWKNAEEARESLAFMPEIEEQSASPEPNVVEFPLPNVSTRLVSGLDEETKLIPFERLEERFKKPRSPRKK